MSAVATMILYGVGIMFVAAIAYFVVKEAVKDALTEWQSEKNTVSKENYHAEH
ncbi:MAG: hypothetical protein ACI4LI_05745 [Candidatus Fimenecus sp.]